MDFPGKKVMPRYFVIAVLLGLLGMLVLFKALYIMTVKKDFWMEVSSYQKATNQPISPTRGDILADNGEVLAASIPEYKMFMDFMSWEKDTARVKKDQGRRDWLLLAKMDSICEGLHAIFPDISPKEMRALLLEGRRKKKHHWPLYKKRITYIQYRQVKQLPLLCLSENRGGFHVDNIPTRKNPYGELAKRTIGSLYGGKDSAVGGLELQFDSVLRGKPGYSHRQRVYNKYISIVDQPAVDGCDLQTTINISMQDICEQALGDQLRELQAQGSGDVNFGVCILMEVATGDVKAITSLSRLKDNTFAENNIQAVTNMMEPGSVFKPMSFLVAFNDGYIHLDDPVNVGNGVRMMYKSPMRDHNWRTGGYGTLTVRQCIQKSSNVGVSYFIDKYYHSKPQQFVDGIRATGVADDLHIPIPGYQRPYIKSPKEKGWAQTDLPWMSIGYVTQIPPISTLTFYNGIANNGRMMRPRFVKGILRNGEMIQEFDPVVVREHMAKDEAVKNIQTCLREVVTLGVGKKAGSKLVKTAGKTGTAQVFTGAGRTSAYLVSFAGYFPFDNPKYSCIVCINKTGAASGGLQCGPVFRRVAETVMAQQLRDSYKTARDSLNIHSPVVCSGNVSAAGRVMEALGVKYADEAAGNAAETTWGRAESQSHTVRLAPVSQIDGEMPDVRGFGLRDAVYCLERQGLKVKAIGRGRVTAQSIPAGQKLKRGANVVLTLGDKKENIALSDSLWQQMKAEEEEELLGTDSAASGSRTARADSAAAVKQPSKKENTPARKPEKLPEKPKATPPANNATGEKRRS